MPSINAATICGHLGKDPEVRYTAGGTAVMTFSVATDHRTKKGEEWTSETTWHNVVVFKPSEYLTNGLHKGTTVFLTGRIQNRSYEAKDGGKRYVSEIVADKVWPITAKGERNSDAPVSAPRSSRKPAPPADQYDGMGISDDDMAF